MTNNSASKQKKRQAPSELRWVLQNIDRFNHETFFNEHMHYSQLQATRRFNTIVRDWIADGEKKKKLENDYNEWLNDQNAVATFWVNWHILKALQNDVESAEPSTSQTVSAMDTETGTITSSSSTVTIDLIDRYLSNNITIPTGEPYVVNDFNVSLGFYAFQMNVKEIIKNGSLLTFESHPAHILSMLSILLLCQRNNDLVLDQKLDGLSRVVLRDRLNHVNWGLSEFPGTLLDDLKVVYRKLMREEVDIDTAIQMSTAKSLNHAPTIKRSVGVFTRLLNSLPFYTDQSEIKERRLCSRYLQGIFQGLFDDRKVTGGIMFDFSDEQTIETVNSGVDLTKRRPDGAVVSTYGNISKTLAFVEVKPFSDADNMYKLNIDLIRLGVFAKNTLDTHNSSNIMVIQAVGMNLTFYLVQRTTDELYTMFELDSIRFPASIHEMTMMFGVMDKIMDIIQTFELFCVTQQTISSEVYRESLKSPVLRAITEKSCSRKRKSFNQNTFF